MKKLICTFLYIFFLATHFSFTLFAEQIVFRQISLEQGLSQSKVVAIRRDYEGFLWAGTEDGINRISQSGIKTYHFDYGDSLRGNFIFFIEEDCNQNLWVGTDKGLLTYNRLTDEFDVSEYSKHNYTACLSEENQIIFKAYDHLLIVNKQGHRYIKFENNKLFNSSCKIVRKDINHLILTGYWQGIYELNLSNGILRGLPIRGGSACTSIAKDNENRYWIGFYGNGIKCLDSGLNIYKEFDFCKSASASDNLIMDIKVDTKGKIWVGTDGGGLKIINSKNFEIQDFGHVQGIKNSIPVNNLLNIYIDKNNSAWIGSVSGGLISVENPIINSFQEANLNTPYGLSHNIVTSFAKSDSIIWIGTDGNGINAYNIKTHLFKHFPKTFKLPITSMIDWDEDRLIIVIYNLGIYYFNKHTGNPEIFEGIENINKNIQHTQVSPGIYRLNDESIFIASTHCYIHNVSTKKTINLSEKSGFNHYPSIRLAGINTDTLFLYDNNKVIIFNKKTKRLKKIAEFNTTKVGNVSSMTLLSNDELWFVTRTGLYCYNLNKRNITKRNIPGIFNPTLISSLSEDQLVIGAKDKIVYYEPRKNNIQFYDSSNGLLVNEYSRRACLVDTTDSLLVIGGVNGVSIIPTHINNIKDNPKNNILLTSIYVNGERKAYLADTNNPIKLSAGISKLEFQLNIMDANLFKSPVFRYRLKGYDKEFKSSSHYILDYFNLDPGDYSLEVQYQLSNGRWSKFETLSCIEILPHWWDTWIFKLLITLIFIALIFAYYYKNKKNQERKLEQRIRNYEKDMYQKKIQFFESINHELRTPLTLITGPINRLINNDKSLSDETINTLQKVSNQTDYMKHVINMVLDIRKLDQGITEINYKLTNLVEFIDTIRLEFGDSYDQKGVLLSFQHTLSNEMVWIDQLKIKIILVNLLSNALKFSEPESHVSIVLVEFENNIEISVNDEGAGLKDVDLDNLFNSYYQGK
ncbi:MAG: ligand-binding sensor domain-containing protein, partial [Bacteroidales bacterium]